MSGRHLRLLGGLALASVFTLVGCGGSSGTVTPNFVNSGIVTAARTATFSDYAFHHFVEPIASHVTDRVDRAAAVAQTTGTSIESLQYFIQTIQLCNSIVVNGTGYSSQSGCTTLYENSDAATKEVSYYNTYTIAEAAADTNEAHYVDFMTEAGRNKLKQSRSVDAGTYNYALINFQRPIKMKATFKDSAGTDKFFTKAATSIIDGGTDSGGRKVTYARLPATNTGTAELMTYMLNNGGVFFPLASPFTIASGDSVLLDFVFNAANFATATDPNNTGCDKTTSANTQAVVDANCVTFDLPYAKMAPVPRKAGESTMKEVYLVEYVTSGTNQSKLRVELYYNSADTTKAIRGVDVAVVMNAGQTTSATNVVGALKTEETSNVVKFYAYNPNTSANDAVSLNNLTRRTNGTAKIGCYFNGGPCSVTDGSTIDRSYTYVGVGTVTN